MNNKHTLLFVVLVLLLAGCTQRLGRGLPVAEEATAVADPNAPTATPRPTSAPAAASTVLADGQLVAVQTSLALSFEANGRLLELNVRPGDTVAAGDVLATLDDSGLQEAIASADLQVAQAQNSLAQSQLSLDDLLNWQADETAVALAQANVSAAQTAYDNARTSDAASGNSLTSARINLEQAQRQLADAQKAYNTAYDPGREWELGLPGYKEQLEAERNGASRSLTFAQENLTVSQAQYNLAVAGLNNDTAVSASASLINAQQALSQTLAGPKPSEIAAARLRLEQAEISLAQAQFSLMQAQNALSKAQLIAPWPGTVLSVEVAPGAMVAAGTPIATLLDTDQLQFQTTNLSERDLESIQPGQKAKITLKAFPTQPIYGVVAGIGPQAAGVVGDAAVFTVQINLDDTDLDLRPGMTGRVEIVGES
ncbi:MAG: efflux RND transporter periplasmic adaptor subunit [Chloroflexi bacterium]|nr:efflux RND transporter periplasmic adaptor subunit [Chloroflexota bacterium]